MADMVSPRAPLCADCSSPTVLPFTTTTTSSSTNHPFHYLFILFLLPLLYQAWQRIVQDYRFFLSLGPGGTPSTVPGYIRICLLRIIARRDVLKPPAPLPEQTGGSDHYFRDPEWLPAREGPRPQVAGIAPQRQMTQKGSHENVVALQDAMKDLVEKNPGLLVTGRSCFEKHSLALFLASNKLVDNSNEPLLEIRNPTCGSPPEIAHLHGTDGSLHLTLHPADAKVVIEKGWGERHPLAGRGNFVTNGFTLVYAPRTPKELVAIVRIMRAGCWWVSGVEFEM